MRHAVYARTQAVKLLWAILLPVTVGVGCALWLEQGARGWPGIALLLAVDAALLAVLGHFTVEVGEGRVEWRYGQLGWPRWGVTLDEIVAVEVTTSSGLEGWGIRHTKTGMLYNAQGRQALRLTLRGGRTLRLGSDEPERLASFIRSRMAPARTAASRAR